MTSFPVIVARVALPVTIVLIFSQRGQPGNQSKGEKYNYSGDKIPPGYGNAENIAGAEEGEKCRRVCERWKQRAQTKRRQRR